MNTTPGGNYMSGGSGGRPAKAEPSGRNDGDHRVAEAHGMLRAMHGTTIYEKIWSFLNFGCNVCPYWHISNYILLIRPQKGKTTNYITTKKMNAKRQ